MRKLIILLSLFAVFACKSQTKDIKNVTVVELKEQIEKNKDVQVLDVRTPKEWAEGTIKNALKVNVFDDDFTTKSDKVLNKDKTVYVYCRSGRRSLKACKLLLAKGYKVINVEGGYMAWEKLKN